MKSTMLAFLRDSIRYHHATLLPALTLLITFPTTFAQIRNPKPLKPVNELAKLREDFIAATKHYKASLAKLAAIHDRNVIKAEEKLVQSQKLFAEGLISRNQLAESESAVAAAKEKVGQTERQMAGADTQIAATLLEAKVEAQMSKTPLRKGSLVRTTSYIRYSGAGSWLLSESWKVQRFFQDSFKRPLPVGVFGQGGIHDRWRLDHRNAMDVSLHPDGPEGQALMNFLRANGTPFLAFRAGIPGTVTGPHIHIGRPSHRF